MNSEVSNEFETKTNISLWKICHSKQIYFAQQSSRWLCFFLFTRCISGRKCRLTGAKPCRVPEYKTIERVPVSDPWFEVYKPAAGVFAIYEPHQAEETIGYLIVGGKQALLFDTGMGISDVKKVVTELTKLPIIVLNSHTHDDHVGGNWQFATIYGMDTEFTRTNARGSRADAQEEITPDQICGALPKGFDSKAYVTRPWKITRYIHDGEKIRLRWPHGGGDRDARAYSGCDFADRPRQRPALHRRYILSRADLALQARD